ncbi:hypothetical protein RirG_167430 [Rhizophagus irregularis DAOM 197198w]|uniref:HCP-like protein n=1 Tax=Rhizophagus irregularis (strain DAOM 197198w) TaxID=1432141 RepID=A0A015IX49_RHIIW|nr:hypothetical protein RirG_167430 [Rhizophagus irregularis DAOM 197198w]
MQLNSDLSNTNNTLHKLSRNVQKFDKIRIKEIEPTIQNIHENIFEEDIGIVIDKLVHIYFEELNEGKERKFQYKFTRVSSIDMKKAFKLFQKAASLENNAAQVYLTNMYINGEGTDKYYDKAFELSKKLAKKELLCGINLLGHCHDNGIGTDTNIQKAIELYQKTANLGSCLAQHNLAHIYKNGEGVEMDYYKAFELFKKSAEKEYSGGITMLGYCYNNGIGTDVNKQKAFESSVVKLPCHLPIFQMTFVIPHTFS